MKKLANICRYRPYSSLMEDIVLKNRLRRKYIEVKSLRTISIDVILPTFNRADLLDKSVDSVRRQLHENWFLYICDDGSTDGTQELCKQYESDSRISYIYLPHQGVASARNRGLGLAGSDYISFLDSDNIWGSEYLSLMISFVTEYSLDSAFCAARLIGDTDTQWLGDVFSWQACAERNYIDMNCFIFKSGPQKLLFDETLKRFVDWDFILRATMTSKTSFLPLSLVDYCNKASADRITTTVRQGPSHLEAIRNRYLSVMSDQDNIDARIVSKGLNRPSGLAV